MGRITIRETNSVGESFSEVEYIFEDSSDYFAWSEQKTEALNNALKSYVSGMDFLGGESPFENEDAGNVTEIKVAKKAKEP
uniref:hypothetical protein n=1 Tax=Robertmurraya sp. TaxID=2837525 RepID=UPI003703D575